MLAPSKGSVYEVVPAAELQKKIYAYHAHNAREVISVIGSRTSGLYISEIENQRKQHGANVFTEEKKKTIIHHLWKQLRSPLAFVLVLAFLVTFILGEYVDTVVIAAALSVALFVGVLQEGRSSQAFEKLSKSQVKTATVLRDGKKQQILASELVVGDIVLLQSGFQVPADVRLIQSKQLSVNEASLTGESLAVKKGVAPVAVGTPLAEQSSMVWMGTYIAEGYGEGVVVAVGDYTAMGALAKDVRQVEEVQTPLQVEMIHISRVMLYLISGLVLVIFAVGLFQNNSLHDMLLMSIAIAVASVPEGLPAAVTIILAVGMESLLKRGGLVRNLLAAETLGSTTYVLTDKTGTLTQATMSVSAVITQDGKLISQSEFGDNTLTKYILDVALGATDAYTDLGSKELLIHGDAVEKAIVEAAKEISISEFENSLRAERIDYFAFTSDNRFALGLSLQNDTPILCCNGAPAELLAQAHLLLTEDGEKPFTEEIKNEVIQAISTQTLQGKRLVAVAYKKVQYDDIPEDDENLLSDIVFAGVLVFNDPIRKDIGEAIEGVKSAGAQIILITGDNPQTALSIAQEVGITESEGAVLTGSDLEKLSDEELYIALQDVRVFARVLPSQKMRIASILQQKGEIVAMTGDGINDAPALRKANIGIAIGSGTEVAKEASDLVLVHDSFQTIYAAIEEGRRIISNLRKIVGYLLSTSLSEVVLIGIALLLSLPIPILPAQILWANVIEEGLMSVAFAFEKGDKDAMRRKPKDIHEEGILSKSMLWFVALVVAVHGLLLVSFYLYLVHLKLPLSELRSMMFLAVSADSLFISFAFRSLTVPAWRVPLANNLFFVGSFFISAILLAGVLSVPFLQKVLSYTPLPWYDIAFVAIFSLTTLVAVEVAKWLFFAKKD